MTSRDRFEAWWERFYEHTPMEPWDELYSPENDFYFDQIIDGQYDARKASRGEEIELPLRQEPTSSGHYGEGYLVASSAGSALDYEDTVDAIRAAGFKVKGG